MSIFITKKKSDILKVYEAVKLFGENGCVLARIVPKTQLISSEKRRICLQNLYDKGYIQIIENNSKYGRPAIKFRVTDKVFCDDLDLPNDGDGV